MRKKSYQNPNLLYRYYRKFTNLQKRISLLMRTGEFYELSRDFRNRMIRRLKLLYDRITRLAGKQKLKWAGAAMALILSASVANAQFNDPVSLTGFITDDVVAPTLVDLDDDGDLDIVIGGYDGELFYVENDNGDYIRRFGAENPFDGIDVGYYSAPALADADDDGDLDLVVGDLYGSLAYFENDGGTFVEQLGLDNPWDGVILGYTARPSFADFDDDGDPDLTVGHFFYALRYWEYDAGNFTELTGVDNPFDGLSLDFQPAPGFVDFDGDGDLDLYVGEKYGTMAYFENDGGTFVAQTGSNNPFDNLEFGMDSAQVTPFVTDVDGDSDLDLALGTEQTMVLRYFRNDGGTFTEKRGGPNPFEGIGSYTAAAPAFADIDDDGDLDLLLGDFSGLTRFFENTADGLELRLTEEDNPFYDVYVNYAAKPVFNDIDEDGDMDLTLGDYDGILHYYENENGDFFEMTGTNNPFDEINTDVVDPGIPYFAAPTFADLDDDGDGDLVVGHYYGTPYSYGGIEYYRNVSGEFFGPPEVDNPFDFIYGEANEAPLSPTFADIDRDGDLDLYVGDKYGGAIFLYENDGGVFTKVTGPDNPFDGLIFYGPAPTFADVDEDGDLDLYVGGFNKYNGGELYFIENTQGPNSIDADLTEDLINIYSFDHTVVVDGGSSLIEQVEVYTISGALITSEIVNQSGRYELYLPEASPGIYLVRAIHDGEPSVEKVAIK